MNYSSKKAGFTLLELLVVISISTIIMTTLVIQQSQWNDHLIVSTQAYELALMIRQAQIYSLGVREDKTGSETDKFDIGYGMYFSVTGSEKIVFFADRDGDYEYDSPGEKIEEKTLTRGVTISKVCRTNLSCPGSGPKKVSISFLRPDPKAYLYFRTSPGVLSTGGPGFIILTSPGGRNVTIKVENNGQISVQ